MKFYFYNFNHDIKRFILKFVGIFELRRILILETSTFYNYTSFFVKSLAILIKCFGNLGGVILPKII